MGNCIYVSSYESQDQNQARVITYDGEIFEFRGSTKAKKVASGPYSGYILVNQSRPFSPLSPKMKLGFGEVYYLVPDVSKVFSKEMARVEEASGSPRQKVKVVLTRKELESLLRMSKKVVVHFDDMISGEEGLGFQEESPKWRPSLSSIAEVKDF